MSNPPHDTFTVDVVQYLSHRDDEERAKEQANEVKERLRKYIVKHGYTDERGNTYVELPKPVQVGDRFVSVLKLEKRIQLIFDEDAAIELAEQRGVRNRLVKTMEYVDQDEIYVLYQEDVFSEEDIDSLFTKKESFAIRTMAD